MNTLPPLVEIRGYAPGDEAAIVNLLNSTFPGGWGSAERWRARHADRPGFDPRDIYLAYRDGALVGCLHVAVVPMRVGPGTSVLAGLDGDLAVLPEARGLGVPEFLYETATARLRERGVAIRMGYTDETSRAQFYQRALGYVTGFDRTCAYAKSLTTDAVSDPLLRRFGSSRDIPDPGTGPLVEFAVRGLPPFRIRLGGEGVALSTDGKERSAIRLAGDQRMLGLLGARSPRIGGFLDLLRRDEIRIEGSPWGALRVVIWYLASGRRLLHRRAVASPG